MRLTTGIIPFPIRPINNSNIPRLLNLPISIKSSQNDRPKLESIQNSLIDILKVILTSIGVEKELFSLSFFKINNNRVEQIILETPKPDGYLKLEPLARPGKLFKYYVDDGRLHLVLNVDTKFEAEEILSELAELLSNSVDSNEAIKTVAQRSDKIKNQLVIDEAEAVKVRSINDVQDEKILELFNKKLTELPNLKDPEEIKAALTGLLWTTGANTEGICLNIASSMFFRLTKGFLNSALYNFDSTDNTKYNWIENTISDKFPTTDLSCNKPEQFTAIKDLEDLLDKNGECGFLIQKNGNEDHILLVAKLNGGLYFLDSSFEGPPEILSLTEFEKQNKDLHQFAILKSNQKIVGF